MIKTAAGDFRIWIFDRCNYAFDACLNQRVSARCSAALVRVRFERYVRSSTARSFAGLLKRDRLRVFDLIVKIEPFADDRPMRIGNHRADQWPRTDLTHAARGEIERAAW